MRFSPNVLIQSLTGAVLGAVGGSALVTVGAMLAALAWSYDGEEYANILGVVAGAFGYGALMGSTYALPVALIIGWPLHLLLMWRGLTGILIYLAAGAVLAAATFATASLVRDGDVNTGLLVIQTITGLVGATIFWLVRRPDREHARF